MHVIHKSQGILNGNGKELSRITQCLFHVLNRSVSKECLCGHGNVHLFGSLVVFLLLARVLAPKSRYVSPEDDEQRDRTNRIDMSLSW